MELFSRAKTTFCDATATLALIAAVVGVSACTGGGGTSSSDSSPSSASSSVLTADVSGANTVGRVVINPLSVAKAPTPSQRWFANMFSASDAYASGTASIADKDLVAISSAGTLTRIFNSSFAIYDIKATTNYLIVAGQFVSRIAPDGKPEIIDSDGNALICYLLAVKKTARGKPDDVICLSKVQVGSYSLSLAPTNSHYSHLGFAVRGDDAYFTDWANGKLYKWNDISLAITHIFTLAPPVSGVGLDDVFVDPNGGNICVLMSALSTPFGIYYGDLSCGTDAGLVSTITGGPNQTPQYVLAETRLLGHYVVTTDKKIDLTTLVVSDRIANGSNGGLPAGEANIATAANGAVFIGYAWSLSSIDANGNTCVLATTNGIQNTGCAIVGQMINAYFQSLYKIGNSAWTYGTSAPYDLATGVLLQRIDLTNFALDPVNYMNAAGMVSIVSLSMSPDGRLLVKGKDQNGRYVSAFIDSSGTITQTAGLPTEIDKRVSF